jgi:hypothetical protein
MRNWSIPIGRLFGVEIRVHLTFVFLLGFVWMAESAMKSNTAPAPNRVLALIGIIFGAVIAHELGHALVARREGLQAKAIILLPIGGITLIDDSRQVTSPTLEARYSYRDCRTIGQHGYSTGRWTGGAREVSGSAPLDQALHSLESFATQPGVDELLPGRV